MIKKQLLALLFALAISGCVLPQLASLPTATPPPTYVVTPMPTLPPTAGSLGDPLFPQLGNAGYAVDHYTLDLTVDVATNTLTSTATIRAQADLTLDRLHLDFHGLTIEEVTIDGESAVYTREEGELIIEPAAPIAAGHLFTATIRYFGQPEPQPLAMLGEIGWLHMGEGILVVSQPTGAGTWFPANDHPQDKATYTLRITVPQPYVAASNGLLAEVIETETERTYVWEVINPMASYLATVAIYPFEMNTQAGPGGLPILNFIGVELPAEAVAALERTPEMIEFLETRIGPYPFESYGAIVVDLHFSLETQTRSIISRGHLLGPREEVVMHELAHQWFGNSLSLAQWQDIWLNEGFATYLSWLWTEHIHGPEVFDNIVRASYQAPFLAMPPGTPSADTLFHGSVYVRGALTLHALRVQVGDEAFFEILQTYYARYRDSHVTTADFIAVAEEVSGQSLADFFQSWLYTRGVPPFPER
ncbi:MAG: M1 family metallopeptidase [Caldilineaceae bacterium]|nr:M1 family metallopeptidase [Caldilineaceae bacterium]